MNSQGSITMFLFAKSCQKNKDRQVRYTCVVRGRQVHTGTYHRDIYAKNSNLVYKLGVLLGITRSGLPVPKRGRLQACTSQRFFLSSWLPCSFQCVVPQSTRLLVVENMHYCSMIFFPGLRNRQNDQGNSKKHQEKFRKVPKYLNKRCGTIAGMRNWAHPHVLLEPRDHTREPEDRLQTVNETI